MRPRPSTSAAHRLAALFYQDRKVAEGKCRSGDGNPVAGGVYCVSCRERANVRSLARYYRRSGREIPRHVEARIKELGRAA